jgi:hypothetical protein
MLASKLPVVAVALLLVLAGCTGGGGGDGGAAPATDTEAPADPGSGGGSGGSSGADDDDRGADEGALSLTDPEVALEEAGSFTSTWRYSGMDVDGVEGAVSYTYRADLDAERAYVSVTSEQDGETVEGGFATFTTDGVVYTRFGGGDESFYQARPQESQDLVAESLARTAIYGTDIEGLANRGAETYEGVRVTRYELTQTDSSLWATAATAGTDPGDLDEFEVDYVVLVDGDGLVRYESWSFTGTTNDGQDVNGMWEYSLTAVGSTTVEDPDWLDDAKAQTGN